MEVRARPISGGASQEDWGEEMTIVNWEKGRAKPIKQHFERLEKILGDLPSS